MTKQKKIEQKEKPWQFKVKIVDNLKKLFGVILIFHFNSKISLRFILIFIVLYIT